MHVSSLDGTMNTEKMLMQQPGRTDSMKDGSEHVNKLQEEGFKSVFVPHHDSFHRVPSTRVVTLDDIVDGKSLMDMGEEDLHTAKVRAQPKESAHGESRRTRNSARYIKYKEFASDQSSAASSSASIYSMSDADDDDEMDESDMAESGGTVQPSHDEYSSDRDVSRVIIDENSRQIAYIDAFRRVSTKPLTPFTMVPPCIISGPQGLLARDSDDTSSLTMSLSDKVDEKEDLTEVQQPRSKKRSLLDTLADVAEQASKKTKGGRKKAAMQKLGTDEPTNTTGKSWYPGYDIEYGMGCVHADALRNFSHPDPVYQGKAPRWRAPEWSDHMLPTFHGEDTIAKSIQYLKYAAQMAGMLIDPPLEAQKGVVEQYATFEDTLNNVTSLCKRLRYGGMPTVDTRITRKTQKKLDLSLSPLIFSPRRNLDGGRMPLVSNSRYAMKRTAIVQGDPASGTDVRWGACYQADIPPFGEAGKSSEPLMEREQRLGGTLVMMRGTMPPPWKNSVDLDEYKSMNHQEREAAIMDRSNQLIDSFGSQADLLGLKHMGAHVKGMLADGQQTAYGEGMKKHGRNFPLIHKLYVPNISPGWLAAYYYDVWKTRSVPAAAEFYAENQQSHEHTNDSENPKEDDVILESIRQAKLGAQNLDLAENANSDSLDTVARALYCLQKRPEKGTQ